MRKFYTLCLSILLLSCLSESNVDPGSSATFIRYYNGGNNDESKALEIAADGGFVIVATTTIKKSDADIARTKIKIIKTDASGNPLWQQLYPAFGVDSLDYTASSIQVNPAGGYVIVGDVIDSRKLGATVNTFPGVSRGLVLLVDDAGLNPDTLSLQFTPGLAQKGKAVAIDANGNILALSTQGTQTMILTRISPIDTISQAYTGGVTTLANKLLIDNAGKAVWSGTATAFGLTGVRLLRTIPTSPTVDFDLLLSEPGYSLQGFDFCKYGLGYAIAGATNQKPGGGPASTDTDILFYLTTSDGLTTRVTSFPFDDPNTPQNEDNQIDAGNAIASTLDGGLIFLSAVNSAAIEGRGDSDFYMIKIDAFGNKIWTSSFGSKFKDDAVAIRQLQDGSYVALGTTTQGSLKILTLFKTNGNGKID